MCFGGSESPQQPVNPAPYPYAEVTTTNAEPEDRPDPEANPDNNQPRAPRQGRTGARFDPNMGNYDGPAGRPGSGGNYRM